LRAPNILLIPPIPADSFSPMNFWAQMVTLGCLAALVGCAGSGDGASGGGGPGGAGGPGAEPPAPVTIGDVVLKAVPVELRAFGTVEPNATVAVKSQVGGVLVGVHFEKGQDVKKGDLLFTIDPRPARAEKRQIEANLARDKVQ
jgi:multidrug efflux system membrane fusion protein